MGVVYEAVQLGAGNFRKVVAVKLIREEYSAIEEFQNNFIGEARLVADLIHTNIVQTYHLGKIGGQYVTSQLITMEAAEDPEFLDAMRREFKAVVSRKPDASRGRSSEIYLLGKGFLGKS